MQCPLSKGYVQKASQSGGLVVLENEVLEDIATVFGVPVPYAVSDEQLESDRYRIYNAKPLLLFIGYARGGGYFLDLTQRVFVVQHSDWLVNRRIVGPPLIRGRYNYNLSAMFLHENANNKNSWCRSTLIHEILHGTSIFAKISQNYRSRAIWNQQRALREGITECLTGYVLYKRHPDCYEGWHSNQLFRCDISYPDSVKLWCSLSQCVGIKELAGFYLASADNLANPWDTYAVSLQNKGFGDFSYTLDENNPFNETRFRDVCINSIPPFREIYESLTKPFDFSQIP